MSFVDKTFSFPQKLQGITKFMKNCQNVRAIMRLVAFILLGGTLSASFAGTTDGPLKMEVITAYNFVVDSNIESPAGKSPSAAHLGVRVYNTGPTALTNVVVNIGRLTDEGTSTGTPGTFESRTVNQTGQYAGTFALQMPGGAPDAVRTIPRIEAGQSVVQYFFVTYPLKDGSGNSVTGSAPVVTDDLWLNYDIWAYATEGASTRRVNKTTRVTMRNEISAMANKIWPNGDNKVPDQYLDVIEASLGWRPTENEPRIPGAKITEGIWYDLGNIGAGFDNNGDGIPDRNAWLQPVGDPSQYSPLAARMVKCYGLVIVKLNDGTEQLIPFEDRLYFENMLADNTGAVGLVYYEFLPLNASYPSNLTPYQEVASGYDNEKFNADYGTVTGSVATENPTADIEKTGPATRQKGQVADYSIVATNTGDVQFGWPDLGVPVVIEDPIPAGLQYVSGSAATASNVTNPAGGVFTVHYSTDNGSTWTTTEPVPATTVNRLRWVLDRPLDPDDTATVVFSATVPSGFVGSSFTNTAILKLGTETEIDRDDWPTTITGNNSIGDFVWRDLNRNGLQDDGLASAVGIVGVDVSLYVDTNNNQVLDSGEPLYATTSTGANGAYLFSNLPDGRYIAVVNATDPQLPTAYTLKAGVSDRYAVNLDAAGTNPSAVNFLTADWPFIQGLEVTKTVSPTVYNEGDLITYDIHLDNHMSTLTLPVPNVYNVYANSTVFDKTNAADKANEGSAAGAPNNQFVFIDWNANSDRLVSTGVSPTFALPGGSAITKVELIVRGYQSTPLSNDQLDIQIGHSDRAIALFQTRTTAQMNALVGVSQDLVIDVTAAAGVTPGWTAAEINSLSAALASNATNQGDTGDYNVDSIGFRITTSNTPFTGSAGPNTIAVWPLKDTYDPAKLQFVSASLLPDVTTPAGTLEWFNLGPVNAGVRKSITVTFRALSPTDTNADFRRDPMVANNYVTTQGLSMGDVPLFQSGLPAGHDDGTVNVTINPTGRIGDFVYWDINANNTYNVGTDIPLQGVIVRLFQSGVYIGRSQITDANGYYEFAGLADGTYEVRITTQTGTDLYTLPWTANPVTSTQRGTVATTVTSNTFVAGNSVTLNNTDFDLTNDTNFLQDFGFDTNVASVIAGTLFRDWDGDGIQDPGDEPLVGYTVTLTGTNSRTTTTDANGNYTFTNLTGVGESFVTVTAPPASHTQTLDPDGTLNSATTVNVVLGNAYLDRDFAYRPTGSLSIGDTLYYDWNGNAIQDAGEGGIPNVTVHLHQDENGDGVINTVDALMATTTTDADGFYEFTGLAAGNYIVEVDEGDPDFPISYIETQDYDGLLDNHATVNLTVSLDTVDFGYQPIGTTSIGNLVWRDTDNDGIRDAGEAGIDGVTVQLFRSNQTPGVSTPYFSTTTSGGGFYSFTGLPVGSYTVYIPASNFGSGQALASLQLSSSTTVNSDNQTDNDDNGIQSAQAGATSSPLIALSPGESDQTIDFGFTGSASIGDIVFYDLNGNGNLDYNEPGINGVVMELYLDVDQDGVADGPFIATTTTATSGGVVGFYEFTGLAPNTYIVKVRTSTLPAGVTQTADPDLDGIPVNNTDLDPNNNGDHADTRIILFSGSVYTGADFGYQPPGAIGDFVWLDLNQDGVQDPGEPGIANVEIQISGASTYSVFTDPDGYWSTAVADGNWTVTVLSSNFNASAPLENRAQTYDTDGTGTANTTSLVVSGGVVTTPSGLAQGNLGIDFGYSIDGDYGIAGTVVTNDTRVEGTADDIDDFFDDGTDLDAGPLDETELEGILVYLYQGSTFLGTTTTDAAGNYSFSGLPNGEYNVIIGTTDPPLDTAILTTTAANNTAVSVVNSSSGTTVIQTVTIADAFVSDVDFAFISGVDYDFGDLPLSYAATTLAQDGARHIIPDGGSTVYLGSAPDTDINGIGTSLANGDDIFGSDDEDGVSTVAPALWIDGVAGGSVQVDVTGDGWLVGWVDWNHDGDFLDPGEFIISQAVSTGSSVIAFDIPNGTISAASESWLSRFRIFTTEPAFPLFSYTGVTTDGEVEDHLLEKPVGGSIGDLVWNDANGDSLLDSGEEGIGGVTVELRNGSNSLIGTQITSDGTIDVDGDGVIDPIGYYRFRGLGADNYTVTVTPPAGFTPSYDEDGIVTPNTSTVSLASGIQHLSADFGYEPALADISGQVRYDADGDGNLSDTDSGAAVVKIQLWTDPNGDGDPSDGVQVGETYTDASGNYIFTDVPSGNYVVVEINPSGSISTADVDGGNPDRIAVTLVGVDITGRDFLDTLPPVYALSGTVYDDNDITNDNVIGADDKPIAGVTVKLYLDRDQNGLVNAGDTLLNTTSTNGSGAYSFTGLPAGRYVVEETDPGTAISEWDAQGNLTDNQIAVTITNSNVTNLDFLDDGYLGAIAGSVLVDIDNNDTGDTPIVGVTITLKDGSGNDIDSDPNIAGIQPTTTVTAADGSYSFTDLPLGNYQVVETQPSGYLDVTDTDGGTDSLVLVTVISGSVAIADFIEEQTATISGFVRADIDNNDTGDEPLEGVVLTLKDSLGNDIDSDPITSGVQPTTTLTAADGSYSFTNLPAGNYQVVEVQPSGYISVSDVDGGDLDIIGDVTLITAVGGATTANQDFVEEQPAVISGFVLADTDNNDTGDSPIEGVTLTLKDASGNDIDSDPGTTGVQPTTTVTAADGSYSFTNVPAGDYQVVEIQPSGYVSVSDVDGGNLDIIGDVTLITATAGATTADQNFVEEQSGTITGTVLADTNNDDIGDNAISGVTITLKDGSGNDVDSDPNNAGIQPTTTVTAADGSYSFTNLPAGDYQVVETQPSGYLDVTDTDGGTDSLVAVTVTPGSTEIADFIEEQPSAISGFVLVDTDNNNTGDDPLAGVTLTLKDGSGNDVDSDPNTGGIQPTTTVTAADGSYSFTNLPAGNYQVVETQPSSYVSVSDVDGGDLNIIGDVTLIATTAGSTTVDQDFVEERSGTVNGHLYIDIDGNGTQDGSDPNLAGVDVTITDSNGNVQTVTTDSSGNWSAIVAPGSTSADVDETDPEYPSGYTQTEGDDPTSVTAVVDANTFAGNDGYSLDLDTDDDGIPDTVENDNVCPSRGGDTDGDGVPDYLDLDSDGDGIFDVVEAGNGALDADMDGRIDSTQGSNGLADIVETAPDSGVINYTPTNSDLDDRPDYLDLDSDNDSISDVLESGNLALSDIPVNVPLIGIIPDGIADGTVNVDGIVPGAGALPVNNDADSLPDYIDVDSDGDGVFDIVNNGWGYLDVDLNGMIDNVSSPDDCDGIADVLDPRDDEYGWFPVAGCVAWNLNAASDIDGDVFPIDQEYAFGGDPELGDHLVAGTTRRAGMTIEKNGTVGVPGGDPGEVDISIVRPRGRYDVIYTLYVSDDPRDELKWTAVSALPVITDNGDNTETLKWSNVHDIDGNPAVTRDRGFARLKVETPCNPAGSWTLVQGWCRQNLVGKYQTYGLNFSSMPVFTGIIDDATLSAIFTASSSKGLDLSTYLTPGSAYFLEVTDGPSEGHRFEVVSGEEGRFVLDLTNANNTTNALPNNLAGSHFVVRKHETLGSVYANGEWNMGDSPNSADQVLFHNGVGYDIYYNLSSNIWVKQGDGFDSRNSQVIAPGIGMMIVHTNLGDTNELLTVGDLRYNDFRRPLKLGARGLNFMDLGYPFAASPASLNMTEANGFVRFSSPNAATQIQNWLGDTTPNTQGWTTNFLLLPTSWHTQGNLTQNTTNALLFKDCRSNFVLVRKDNLSWTHPLPWILAPWVQP